MPSVLQNKTVVLGLEDTKKKLLSLPGRLGINVIRRGLLAGAGVIRDEARRLAPQPPGKSPKGNKRTGKLKKSIVAASKLVKGSKGTKYQAVVSIRKPKKPDKEDFTDAELEEIARKGGGPNPRAYAHLVESGTAPHAVGKGSKRHIALGKIKVRGHQRGATHPGTAAQPFIRNAFDTKAPAAVQAFTDTFRRELGKEVAAIRDGKPSAKGGS